ncbi:hypothetical protein L207DRAFT_511779 [Hyaloscypha variabilis F]|uniref:Uncharacterized protein n=1 Tax=Hyaloscypha variabilis (strain UAMH 11265 / GT02V1 / F) TaxID=1149755 RepID=A0A2J6RP01_HYAVF|nr:hypothetical protein L207DRAFT_511779 [Hyaloscypha variabilis F]
MSSLLALHRAIEYSLLSSLIVRLMNCRIATTVAWCVVSAVGVLRMKCVQKSVTNTSKRVKT